MTDVYDTSTNAKYTLACHCGAVQLRLHLPCGIQNPRRCNCSICRRKGSVSGAIAQSDLTIEKGHDVLSGYQFNTHVATHYFCSKCGVHTHHQRRSNSNEFGYNVACLIGLKLSDVENVMVSDGVSHPADRGL
ncbi:GFA family protein [Echinimonas agarilytica]|uniref:GFA family protein n=1 Tax=Echinimonas agarilytica TaxID=1215918 RepID=A0AA41W4X2_9GAMM|nr:GFA family protein [Echinimonas agarilytica]MCM2678749.1 GFA family protein [Echinimonas agarilytica]